MIWQNAWGWLGIAAIGVPVLIHLLARHTARVQRFPTLRFLEKTRLIQAKRSRLSDLLLLLVRAGVILGAVAALAGPFWLTPDREMELGRLLTRAIIVDTSASMARISTSGESARDAALRIAARLAAEASSSVLLHTAHPADALDGAISWLGARPGRSELIIVSDFQLGAVDSVALAKIPERVGVKFNRLDVRQSYAESQAPLQHQQGGWLANIRLAATTTDVEWSAASERGGASAGILVLAGDDEQRGADAAVEAAMSLGVASGNEGVRPTVVVYPGHDDLDELLRGARRLDAPWMGDVVSRMRADSTLAAAAALATPSPPVPAFDSLLAGPPFVPLATTATGRALAFAAVANVNGVDRLMILAMVDAGSFTSAALVHSLLVARDYSPLASELEPGHMPDELLRFFDREPSANMLAGEPGSVLEFSDARWFWMFALLLLGMEALLRRTPRPADAGASG